MLFSETLIVALASLRANKLRSMLTMLGIVMGIAAVIAMIALGNGAQQAVEAKLATLGTTMLQVDATRQTLNGVQLTTFRRITAKDAELLRDSTTQLLEVEPQEDQMFQVTFRNKNFNTRILAAWPNFPLVHNYEIDLGRMYTTHEDSLRRRVAVVGALVPENLGVDNPYDMLGANIRIRGIQFQVIGVLKSKGSASSVENPDEQILVPLTTARFRLFGSDNLGDIFVLVASEDAIPVATAEIEHVMRRAHKIRPGDPNDFRIRFPSDLLNAQGETAQVFTFLLAGIAAVSLLVGGIGIMNIMLVSVTERTREIGVRKALGATRTNILLQFLIEAIVLCLVGGSIGIASGVGASVILHRFFGWNTVVAPSSIGLAFGFAVLVGLVFGVWPARRASVLDPITALRYE